MFDRYLVRKTEGGMTAWLVVTETDAGEEVGWSNKREEGTPLLKWSAEAWMSDPEIGGELDPVNAASEGA